MLNYLYNLIGLNYTNRFGRPNYVFVWRMYLDLSGGCIWIIKMPHNHLVWQVSSERMFLMFLNSNLVSFPIYYVTCQYTHQVELFFLILDLSSLLVLFHFFLVTHLQIRSHFLNIFVGAF